MRTTGTTRKIQGDDSEDDRGRQGTTRSEERPATGYPPEEYPPGGFSGGVPSWKGILQEDTLLEDALLEGIFQESPGRYPPGTYPPTIQESTLREGPLPPRRILCSRIPPGGFLLEETIHGMIPPRVEYNNTIWARRNQLIILQSPEQIYLSRPVGAK